MIVGSVITIMCTRQNSNRKKAKIKHTKKNKTWFRNVFVREWSIFFCVTLCFDFGVTRFRIPTTPIEVRSARKLLYLMHNNKNSMCMCCTSTATVIRWPCVAVHEDARTIAWWQLFVAVAAARISVAPIRFSGHLLLCPNAHRFFFCSVWNDRRALFQRHQF